MSCEEPVDHSNIVFINYSSTDFGSNVTYYCKVDPSVLFGPVDALIVENGGLI